jgi:single-strand DNA-binding protein
MTMKALSLFICLLYGCLLPARSFHCPGNLKSRPTTTRLQSDWQQQGDFDTSGMMNNQPSADRPTDEELEASLTNWDDKIARFNTVHLVGRLGSDPEARHFDDGKVVVNVSLASKRKYHAMARTVMGIKSGEEETDWYGLEIWGRTAEFVAKYVDKGARVGVIGTLQVDQWTDKSTGEPRSKVKVIVRDFDVLETKAEADLRRGGGGRKGPPSSYSNDNDSRRGPSFYTNDDNDDGDQYSRGSAGTGGFFD